jgi:DNA polymerase-3 subunit epsilon
MPPTALARPASGEHQGTFDELGQPLYDVTFVVVDLETTGGSPADSSITEVGAVKIRGGEVLGEFATLVNPGRAIPPMITVLTGITDAMVLAAPPIGEVLPAFLEFARGSVLVAHNAPFDLGFLRAACALGGYDWPGFESVDTARLARQVLARDEVPDCRLATLARLFRTSTVPCHRALDDARATVDVLHRLVERLAGFGVTSLEELRLFSARVTPAQRRKRHLADPMPTAPGVYLFRDGRRRVLYVGKSGNLRSRVRSYFTAGEHRSRIAEMVAVAESVEAIECPTLIEAEVRELRLIAEHRPRYNRRSRFPERAIYLKLTVEPFPRLSQVRQVRDDGAAYLGPFASAGQAELAAAALHEAFPLRQCTGRLSVRKLRRACVLHELGRCGAPCEGRESPADYARHVAHAAAAIRADPEAVVLACSRRIETLLPSERYEEAALHRDRVAAFVRAAARLQRLTGLTVLPQLVAAVPRVDRGWDVGVVRWGRLAASIVVPAGTAPSPYLDAAVASAETVPTGYGPTPAASAEESEVILRWLESPGARLIALDGVWACPARGAARAGRWLGAGRRASAR